jgi:hypothetical protein
VVACVTDENLASVRVLEKAGLRRVGGPVRLPGEEEGSVKYALTRDQFDYQRGQSSPAEPGVAAEDIRDTNDLDLGHGPNATRRSGKPARQPRVRVFGPRVRKNR